MKKINTIHIHTDFKFISSTKIFQGNNFSNTIIVIGEKKCFPDNDIDIDIIFFKQNDEEFRRIIKLCSKADLVVLYDLNPIKIKIALQLNPNVKIIWRFFGYELYKLRPDLYKSNLSRKYDTTSTKQSIKFLLTSFYSYIKEILKENKFDRVMKRIDYFLAISEEEYIHLKQYYPNIPKFIKVPRLPYIANYNVDFNLKNHPLIIIGNNRSSYNNHLDILEIIEKYENKTNYNFTLFFNYGKQNKYTDEVIRRTNEKNYFSIIDKFLNSNDFLDVYKRASGLVINGYRQMAGANIRTALEHGVKIYLNNKNVHKQFLEKEGFKIFSIEDFEEDLKHNNLQFDKEVALYNLEILKRYTESYSYSDFQSDLLEQINTSEIRTKIDP